MSNLPPCNFDSVLLFFLGLRRAGVAQLVEHLICNQRVGGSNPSASSAKFTFSLGDDPVHSGRQVPASRTTRVRVCNTRYAFAFVFYARIFPRGRVGEWLKPADCKSAAPCGLRRFESSPVHHLILFRGIGVKRCFGAFEIVRAVESGGERC